MSSNNDVINILNVWARKESLKKLKKSDYILGTFHCDSMRA